MASPGQSIVDWNTIDLTVLTDLPARLDDAKLAAVEHIAQLPLPAPTPAPEQHFLQCMRTLTLLPSRQEDDLSAELRLALYRKHFGRYPAEAWAFLVEHATLECRFFPTPAECKAILDRWHRKDSPALARAYARDRARQEREARFEDVMRRFRCGEIAQDEVDQLPERWKRIAAAQGFVRDGTYQLRDVPAWRKDHGGHSPAVVGDQHTGAGQEAGQLHERTGQ